MRILFRAGATVLLLFALAHLAGHFQETPPANETERRLLELMKSYSFTLPGAQRTMWDLFSGFSLMMSAQSAALGVLGLLLRPERRFAVAFALASAAATAISLAYFFAIPTAFLALATVLFVLAVWRG